MPSLKGFRANRRGPKSGQRKLADLDALDQEGYPEDRGYARPEDRPVHSLMPAEHLPTFRTETRKPL